MYKANYLRTHADQRMQLATFFSLLIMDALLVQLDLKQIHCLDNQQCQQHVHHLPGQRSHYGFMPDYPMQLLPLPGLC